MKIRLATARPSVAARAAMAGLGIVLALGPTRVHPQPARPASADTNGVVEVARAGTVLPEGSVDGRSVRIDRVEGAETAAATVHRTAQRWRQDGDPVIVLRSGQWQVVSRLTRSGYQMAQLRDVAGGRSEGFMSSWALGGPPDRVVPPDWWPSGARLLRTVASTDGARHAVMRIGEIGLAPAAARGLMAARLTARGWTVATFGGAAAQASSPPVSAAGGRGAMPPVPLHASRGTAAVVVTLEARATGTAFVAHESEVSP